MMISTPISSAGSLGLSDDEVAMIGEMREQWASHVPGNARRQLTYDQKDLFKDLKISTPPQLRDLEAVLGWGAKTVDVVSDRISFERFVSPGVEENPYGLDDLVAENDFRVEFSQAVTSALTHSCSFGTVSQGFDGEPATLWQIRSALQATGLWDRRRRGLKAAMTVEADNKGIVERVFVYFRDKSVDITLLPNGQMKANIVPNLTGRIPVEVFRVKPDLRRPFGRSRITPAVEYFIAGGVRTMVRSEIGAEFFAAPQRYGIGLDEESFDMDKWSAITGRFLAVSRDEEGELPHLGQFSQHSMQPHVDHLRMWAAQLSGESSIPMNELGFVSDNPSSDPAIQSQRDPLRLIAEKAIGGFQSALRNMAATSVMVRDGLRDVPDDLKRVSAWFAPAFRMADSAAADAALKQAQVVPWITESPVFLEKLNYSSQEIDRLLSDKKRSEAGTRLERMAAAAREVTNGDGSGSEAGYSGEPAVGATRPD
ncbi:phage portal protein [Leucobacter sp. CSA1]|uniref:Phage portal protein n=1 Tax=Leucobacter chromiisoli TaxID=2796471 RepID=A0A934Q8G3_9MICO|nr:phage portal protein [Leucobacter chromiisoli]MBK0420164.1 phage portal protein [Leucobacter chromiisoli]